MIVIPKLEPCCISGSFCGVRQPNNNDPTSPLSTQPKQKKKKTKKIAINIKEMYSIIT